MGYNVINTYFKRRLSTFNLAEAKMKMEFEGSAENFNNQYMIENPKTELAEGDTLHTQFFPKRTFVIKLAFKISETALQYEYDAAQIKIENILRDLHSVSNYRGDGIRRIEFSNAAVSMQANYLAAELTFIVTDALAYI